MTTLTIYSKPSCVQCTATYRRLDALGIDYEVVDLSEDAAALALTKRLGHLQAPVVTLRDRDGQVTDHWSGFRPDKIDALALAAAA